MRMYRTRLEYMLYTHGLIFIVRGACVHLLDTVYRRIPPSAPMYIAIYTHRVFIYEIEIADVDINFKFNLMSHQYHHHHHHWKLCSFQTSAYKIKIIISTILYTRMFVFPHICDFPLSTHSVLRIHLTLYWGIGWL